VARTRLAPRVVCDAGLLIHLDELDCLDLLTDFAGVLVPEVVWREVAHHRSGALERAVVEVTRTEVELPDEVGKIS
jgi:hypothetical protein